MASEQQNSDSKSLPYIDPDVQVWGISLFRATNIAGLRAMESPALIVDGGERLAVLIPWNQYVALQKAATGK